MPTFKIKDLLVSVGGDWCGPTNGPCLLSCVFTGVVDRVGGVCTPGCSAGGDSCTGSGGPCRAGCSAVYTNVDGLLAAVADCTPGCTAGGDSCNGSGGPCKAGCSAIVTAAKTENAARGRPVDGRELAALRQELRSLFARASQREADLPQYDAPASLAELDAMERHLAEALEELRQRKATLIEHAPKAEPQK